MMVAKYWAMSAYVSRVHVAGRASGAARGIRTPDPIITNDVLYQLSYCGMRARSAGSVNVVGPSD
jgi:hypothetical protein